MTDKDENWAGRLFAGGDCDASVCPDALSIEAANALLEKNLDAILLADIQSLKLVYANKSAERMLGCSQKAIRNLHVSDLHPTENYGEAKKIFDALCRGDYETARDIPVLAASGSVMYYDVQAVPLTIQGRRYLMGCFRDVHDRRTAQQDARNGEIRFQEAIKALPMGLHVYDISNDGRLMFADSNPAADHILGLAHASLTGKTIEEAFPSLVGTEIPEIYRKIARGDLGVWRKEQVDYKDARIAGAYEVVAFQLRPGTAGVLFWDITERRQTEDEMRRLMAAINSMGESVMITDKNGIIQYVNPYYEELTGFSLDELKGRHIRSLKSGVHDQRYYEKIWQEITNGRTWTGNFVNRKKDGTLFYERASISPVKDAEGNIVSYVAVKLDVTHERDLERRVMSSQKMAALGQFAHRIAHDITNSLSTILGSSEILAKTHKDALSQDLLKGIIGAVDHMSGITANLMAFANPGETDMKRRRLDLMLKSMSTMIERACYPAVTVKFDLEPGIFAEFDEGQLEQAIMHIVVNATEAVEGTGELSVRLYSGAMPERIVNNSLEVHTREIPAAVLEIADNGKGLSEEDCQHAFEPFFTTKRDKRRNAGLGLATVYAIISRHNGDVTIRSHKGQGTVLKIVLPLSPKV